jgi:hypothetical protein
MSTTLVAIFLGLLSSVAFAAKDSVPAQYALSEKDAPLLALVKPTRIFSFGVGFQHYDYAEELVLPMKSRETGLLPVFRFDAQEPASGLASD